MIDRRQAGPAESWRLLIHDPGDGAWNMAVDEALLQTYLDDPAPGAPTLRLYAWEPAALSLGKAQPAAGAHDAGFLRERGIDLVRRPTGGRAVLHHRECTYAVIGGLATGVLETYRSIARALERGLRGLGVEARAAPARRSRHDDGPSCFGFTSAHEITVGGRKLVGSAQLRRRTAFLQHGSVPLRSDPELLRRALGHPVEADASTDLERALGRLPADGELQRALVAGFEAAFEVRLEASALSRKEAVLAEQLRCWKYDSVAWTLGGRVGTRERRWGPAVS